MHFTSSKKLFLFLEYSVFGSDFFGRVGKRLDKIVKVDFRICDVTKWEASNYNTHIVQYLKK